MKFIICRTTTVLILMLITGCTSIPKDLGRSDVDTMMNERGLPTETKAVESGKELVASLTTKSLTAESVMRIALLNNPQLKKTYAGLGFAAADVYQAGRIRNPIFSGALLDSNRSGDDAQITFGLVTSFTDWITLPVRKRLAEGEFAAMKQSVGAKVLDVAVETEVAFYRFVAAKQVAALRAQIAKAGKLSLELAKRYYDAGNLTPRDLALEYAAASEANLDALQSEAQVYARRTELATMMGLSTTGTWDSPAQLPVPLEREDDLNLLIKLARQSRLDLAAATTRADILADRLGVTNWTRLLGELNIGVEHERETDGAKITGPTVDWGLPIFNTRRDALLRVDAELQVAIAEVERLTMGVINGVHLAYAAMQNTKARVTEYRDQLIPARIEAVERAQEEENFMLIGIFELLQTKQQEYDAYEGYLEVVRDYWLARAELTRAVGNTLPSSKNIGKQRLDVEEYIAPKTGGADHSDHGDMSNHSNKMPLDKKNENSGPQDHSQHSMENNSEKSNTPQSWQDSHTEHQNTNGGTQ